MPTMPNVVGLNLSEATDSLESAGVLDTDSLGYFGTWPITANWNIGSTFEIVTAQSPNSGTTVTANSAVTLTVTYQKLGVVYP